MKTTRITPRNIRIANDKYYQWLNDSQIFQMKPNEIKEEWLELFSDLEKAINEKSPTLMWEAVVDHLMCMSCELDGSPRLFQDLYEVVDEYRTKYAVDSTSSINIMLDRLLSNDNKDKLPQVVISELYEELTGDELFCETDPINGEDYIYKRSDSYSSSLSLHPEVAAYFNFKDGFLSRGEIHSSLFMMKLTNPRIAEALKYDMRVYFNL